MRFKETTGTTIVRYITECRMQKAAELLLTTDYRISDFATMVGFEDAGYFTRLFRKEKGVSPAEFRKKI